MILKERIDEKNFKNLVFIDKKAYEKGKVKKLSLDDFIKDSECSDWFLHHMLKDKEIGDILEIPILGRDGAYGWETRHVFTPEKEDHVIVGCDASGIQLRGLAHYMNDYEYSKQILEGDIHTYNQHMAGFDSRKKAKTFN